jgi:sulfoxide reductase heme-binding subunit YedZ
MLTLLTGAASAANSASRFQKGLMSRKTLVFLKTLTWIGCLWPLARLVWGAATNALGPDPSGRIALSTGWTTLFLLTLSLAVTPLRKLSSRLNWLIKFRRLLGLFAFFYACLHLLAYVGLYAGFDLSTMAADISRRRFIMSGMAAWLLLLPLAATSTNWAIRKLGGKRWGRLHKLVYVAALCGLIHYWWQVKPGVLTPMRFTIALAILLAARPLLTWVQRRKALQRATC